MHGKFTLALFFALGNLAALDLFSHQFFGARIDADIKSESKARTDFRAMERSQRDLSLRGSEAEPDPSTRSGTSRGSERIAAQAAVLRAIQRHERDIAGGRRAEADVFAARDQRTCSA